MPTKKPRTTAIDIPEAAETAVKENELKEGNNSCLEVLET